jgi:hypothetical protein
MRTLVILAIVAVALASCRPKAASEAGPPPDEPATAAPIQAHETTDPGADAPAGALPPAQTSATPPKRP